MPKRKRKPVMLNIPVELVEELDKIAEREFKTRTAVLIEAVVAHLNTYKETIG